jgi:putative endonuclease
LHPIHWRDGRVVDCTGLENRHTARYRGFESLSLRFQSLKRLSADLSAKDAKEIKSLLEKADFFYFCFMWTVYILKCVDNTYYVGCTSNIEERISRHLKQQVSYTSTRLPVKIVHQSIFNDKYKAYQFEKYLKTGSGRAFAKKRLITE